LRGLATNIICSFGGRQRESSAAVRSLFWLAILDEFRNSLLRTAWLSAERWDSCHRRLLKTDSLRNFAFRKIGAIRPGRDTYWAREGMRQVPKSRHSTRAVRDRFRHRRRRHGSVSRARHEVEARSRDQDPSRVVCGWTQIASRDFNAGPRQLIGRTARPWARRRGL